MLGRRGLGLVLACALLAPACGDREGPARDARPDLILIVIDTLRADRLHYAGWQSVATPHFDALQRESVWFTRAFATSSWTIPSVASLFTSQHPSRHGIVEWGSRLSDAHTTMVELLQAAGYRTGAWTANRLMAKSRGFAQGFDTYAMVMHPLRTKDTKPGTENALAPADEVTRPALAWLRETRAADPDAPIFAYLHYLEPHTPYLCDERARAGCREAAAHLNDRLFAKQWDFDAAEQAQIRALYDVEVARMDAALGELLRGLAEIGLQEDSWLIVTADHGEQLGEHGEWVHGSTLAPEVVRVPLLVRPPGGRAGIVEAPVSLIDVAPTLLDIAGIDAPTAFAGRSLLPAIDDGLPGARPIIAELHEKGGDHDEVLRDKVAVYVGGDVFVLATDGVLARYDLQADPALERPLPPSAMQLAAFLDTVGAIQRQPTDPVAAGSKVSAEMGEHLKALGYVR